MNELINEIYKISYKISSSRGKLRQTKINEALIDILKTKDEFNDCSFKTEIEVESYCGKKKKFKIDVVVYDKHNQIKLLVLGKAPASNVAQNDINLSCIRVGELSRVVEDTKIIFITFLPNTTPFFKEGGAIKSFEKNIPEYISKWKNREYPRDFDEIYITFDIDGIDNCKEKEDVEQLFLSSNPIKNITIFENSYRKPKIVYE
jgi:hypothetical protein